jgi:hypothetical protein
MVVSVVSTCTKAHSIHHVLLLSSNEGLYDMNLHTQNMLLEPQTQRERKWYELGTWELYGGCAHHGHGLATTPSTPDVVAHHNFVISQLGHCNFS